MTLFRDNGLPVGLHELRVGDKFYRSDCADATFQVVKGFVPVGDSWSGDDPDPGGYIQARLLP